MRYYQPPNAKPWPIVSFLPEAQQCFSSFSRHLFFLLNVLCTSRQLVQAFYRPHCKLSVLILWTLEQFLIVVLKPALPSGSVCASGTPSLSGLVLECLVAMTKTSVAIEEWVRLGRKEFSKNHRWLDLILACQKLVWRIISWLSLVAATTKTMAAELFHLSSKKFIFSMIFKLPWYGFLCT